MNKVLFILVGLMVCMQLSAYGQGQATARSSAAITAEVVDITVAQEESPLIFGRWAPGPEGGQVKLLPDGEVSTKGSVVMIGNAHSPARFYIQGVQDKAFSISLSNGPTVLNHEGISNTMLVHGWDSNPAPGETWKLDDGALGVNVGAILDVNNLNDNPVGLYSGFYSIIFNYH